MKKNILWLAMVMLLASCSSEPMITDYDVLVSENRGELNSLYQRLSADLDAAKINSALAQNRKLYLDRVGRKIAEEKERVILNRLERDINKHDIATLEAEKVNAAEIEPYNRELYLELTMQLQQSIDDKETLIREKEFQFEQLDDNRAPEKVRLLDEIAAIYGGEKAIETQQRRSAYVDALYQQASVALQNKRIEDVKRYLKNLETIQPDYPGLDSLRHGLIAAEYEQQFWDALSKGQTDRAYETYKQLTRIPDYLQKHPDVVPIAEDIARYFIAEGNKQIGVYAVSSAYQAYSRARYVKNTLGQQGNYSEGELKFIDFTARRLQGWVEKQAWIPAYGFLLILQEMKPEHELIQQHAADINNAILQEAAIKIVAADFTNVESGSSLGQRIAGDIRQQLKTQAGRRIDVLENAGLTRADIAALPNAASYYLLGGEVLEAAISQKEQTLQERKQVLISYKRVENPEYIAWTKLKKREKKAIPEPVATIEEPVEDTVTLNRHLSEKQAKLSVTYRLTSSLNGQVVFADAINKDEHFQAESIEPLTVGLFVQEAQTETLPENNDILQNLSVAVAAEATEKIVGQVQMLEKNLLKLADQSVVAENFNAAAKYYAYSYVLLQADNQQDEDLLEKLRNYAIRWKN